MKRYGAIVVGGGYPGCAVAYHLSKAGVETLLLEKKEISAGASGGNFGCIQVQDASLGLSLELTQRSYERVMRFEDELGADLELVPSPSTIVATTAAEMQELEALYHGKIEAGLDVRMLDSKELKRIEPWINEKEFSGATYYVQGRLNPFKLMYSFVRRGREEGLFVQEGTEVRELFMEGGRVRGVVLADGEIIRAERVVVAAGAWTRKLCRSAGIDVPIEYVKAEGFVTEKLQPTIFTDQSSASFFTEAHGDEAGMSFDLAQTRSGNVLIGETSRPSRVDPDDCSDKTSYEHFLLTRKNVARYVPALAKVNLLRAWSTVSPYTESMEPVLGEVGPEGLLVAAGFKSCVVMTAVAGEIITDLVTRGSTFCDLSGYNAQVRPLT